MPLPPDDLDVGAKPWLPGPHKTLIFINANVVDPETSRVIDNATLRIANGLVASLSPNEDDFISVETDDDDEEAIVVDLKGLFVCPGLIDCHTHIQSSPGSASNADRFSISHTTKLLRSTWTLKKQLSLGFTTVRDVGGASKQEATAIAEWLTPGPRLFQGGPVLSQTGGHGDLKRNAPITATQSDPYGDTGFVIDGADAALKAARYIMKNGADHIKVCTSGGVVSETDKLDSIQFTVEELKAITQTVQAMGGTLVTAHCNTNEAIVHSIEGGVGGIEHGVFLDEPTAKLMAEKGVFFTPTLLVAELLQKGPWGEFLSPASKAKNEIINDAGLRAIKVAHDAGVTICYGTDCLAGMQPYQTYEFVLRASVLPSPAVLKHATVNAAKQLGMEGKLGRLVVGAYADLIILKANPLDDVKILDEPEKYLVGIMKDGRCVKSEVDGLEVEILLG
ncbi:amidohydrolase [Cladochytrium replicatum]|nr:amidohydrolase [Cladochytrium replicatum]